MLITGSCHCGATAFEIEDENPEELTRCTCSFCAKRGALYAYYQPLQFRQTSLPAMSRLTAGAQNSWRTTFVRPAVARPFRMVPRSSLMANGTEKPAGLGVNARLSDNFDAAEAPVTVIDGKNLW
jgi:hypothetical protein